MQAEVLVLLISSADPFKALFSSFLACSSVGVSATSLSNSFSIAPICLGEVTGGSQGSLKTQGSPHNDANAWSQEVNAYALCQQGIQPACTHILTHTHTNTHTHTRKLTLTQTLTRGISFGGLQVSISPHNPGTEIHATNQSMAPNGPLQRPTQPFASLCYRSTHSGTKAP